MTSGRLGTYRDELNDDPDANARYVTHVGIYDGIYSMSTHPADGRPCWKCAQEALR
ncbi:hypothetical protein [Isoptericola sp. NPDC055881]